jgi:hypothetical protein
MASSPALRSDGAPVAPPSGAPISVEPVEGFLERSRFLRVPWTVYGGDPSWSPPLLLERHLHLSRRNPYFQHARARFWIARRGGRPVGRISAQVDDLHLGTHRDDTGFFGLLEAIDDRAVFAALFRAAEGWLREQGMKRAIGPFNLSINDEIGTLISGFDTPPMFMMGHGYPYFDERIRECGYAKAKDTVAYLLDPRIEPPRVMSASVRKAERDGVRVRQVRLDHFREDVASIREIFNDAWSENWNYVPYTDAEFDDLGQSLRLFVPPEFVQIAEIDGKAAAMLVAVPNVNETIRDLDGRLFPLGWAKLLWRLKRRPIRSARVPLMGIRKEHQRSALGMALVFTMLEAVRIALVAHGVERLEMSWTLEDNRGMRHIKEKIGAHVYKTYRIYERALV